MTILKSFVVRFGTELLIILLFIFVINNFLNNAPKTIHADGIGYYDVLPSAFIHHDLYRAEEPFVDSTDIPTRYARINSLSHYVHYGHYRLNKYAVGTAVLQSPFFFVARALTPLEGTWNDGYQKPYQRAIFIAALFYLFLGLVFVRKLFELYVVPNCFVGFCQLILVLGTSLVYYTNYAASYSHVYSFFAITAFIYYVRVYFERPHLRAFALAALFFGLVVILRQVNAMVIVFIPFLAGSFSLLINGIRALFKNPSWLLLGVCCIAIPVAIQSGVWYAQVGKWFVYSYTGESFNFLDPQFMNILFSYRKGFFIYTPVMFVSVLALAWFVFKKRNFECVTWLLAFTVITFVLSSWWSWFYGSSYGARAYIDHYTFLLLPTAIFLSGSIGWLRGATMATMLLLVPVNLIQSWQYKEYILHWTDMDRVGYWKVFLRTDDNYKGLLWKSRIDLNEYDRLETLELGSIVINAHKPWAYRMDTIRNWTTLQPIDVIRVELSNSFTATNHAQVGLRITNSSGDSLIHLGTVPLFQFAESGCNKEHVGFANFELPKGFLLSNERVMIFVEPRDEQQVLKEVSVVHLRRKQDQAN